MDEHAVAENAITTSAIMELGEELTASFRCVPTCWGGVLAAFGAVAPRS